MKRNVSRLVLPHEKATALMQSVVVTDVEKVVMPLSMHSGKNAIPVVSVGDHVYVRHDFCGWIPQNIGCKPQNFFTVSGGDYRLNDLLFLR